MRFYTFHSIVPCLFEVMFMPKSSLQECYMLLTAVCLHCILCVHPMSMSFTCVLNYIMPSLQWCQFCIFRISVVTSTSMQSSLRDVADFCDLVISPKSESVIFCCHVNLLLQVILCIIWRCSLRLFCYTCYALSIHSFVCIYSLLQIFLIFLYFCYKMFLADCLHVDQFCHGCYQCSMYPMTMLLPCLA